MHKKETVEKTQSTPISKSFVLDVSNGNKFLITKDKYLIGSLDSADIYLEIPNEQGPFILLVRDGESYDLVSLRNDIDITVNNKLIDNIEKDIVGKTIGILGIELNLNAKTVKQSETLAELPPDLPASARKMPVKKSEEVTQQPDEIQTDVNLDGYSLVDGQYCQITFQDEYVEALDHHPFELKKKIDYPKELIVHNAALDQETEKKLYIEVVVMVRGKVVFVDQIEYQNGIYDLTWGVPEKTPLLVFKDNKVEILTPFGFDKHEISTQSDKVTDSMLDGKVISLFNSPTQIFIREVENDKKPKPYIFFESEREVIKQAATIALTLFIPFLLLLFVDTSIPEKKKEDVAIVYKRLEKPKPKRKPKPKKAVKAEKEQATAQKEAKVADKPQGKKVEEKSEIQDARTPQKVVEKKVSKPQVSLTQQPSAKRKTPSKISTHKKNVTTKSQTNKVARKAPVKTYKLKLKSSFNNLFGKQKSASSFKVKNRGQEAAFAGGANTRTNNLTGLDSSVGAKKAVGAIGGSISGQAEGAYGADGLGDKKGFYATLSRRRTVVMGSMDPELIRRLLREHLSQFRYCYQKEIMAGNVSQSMGVDLKFTIMPNGSVANVDMNQRGGRFSQRGVSCVKSVLGLIDFPRPKGGGRVDIEQPLSFDFSKRGL